MDSKTRSNVKNKSFDINKNQDFGRRPKDEEKTNQGKGIQCHGCKGFSHIRAKCPTYLKKQKKGLSVSWLEDDSESDHEVGPAKQVTPLIGICDSDEDSDCEELAFEELA